MAYCPNCGSEHATLPPRCACGYLFGTKSAQSVGISPAGGFLATAAAPAFTPPPSYSTTQDESRFSFSGQGHELLWLYLKLIGLSIVTLGIYSFWGRTEIRRYLWANIRLAGQPFAYHGTGKELLMGWLKLIGLVVCIFALATVASLTGDALMAAVVQSAILLVVLGFLPFILHGTLRYRLSRTSWQGRRFAYFGDPMELAKIFWIGALLTVVTLGIYLPFFITTLRKYCVDNSWYGGHALQYSGVGNDLLWPWLKFLLLLLPTLGLYRFWFESTMANYNWSRTSFAGSGLRSHYSGGGFLVLAITNGLLLVFTLGIAWPWTVCRQMSYVFDNLRFDELPRVQLTEQPMQSVDALGETMGTDIDLGAGLGL